MDEIKSLAVSNARKQGIAIMLNRIPAHVRHLDRRISRSEALCHAFQNAQTRHATVFIAVFEKQLHANTDPQHRFSGGYHLSQRLIQATGLQIGHARFCCANAGENHPIGRYDTCGISRDFGSNAYMCQSPLDGGEVAGLVVDDGDAHLRRLSPAVVGASEAACTITHPSGQSATMPDAAHPNRRISVVASCWLVHGALLALLGLLLPFMAEMIRSEDWAESMRLLGADDVIAPTRSTLSAIVPFVGWLIGVGLPCILIGAAALRWGIRVAWPLQALAVAHVILVPWSTWALHRHLGDLTSATASTVIGEIITILATEAVLIVAIVIVERARRVTQIK